jgi:hypothetical protein
MAKHISIIFLLLVLCFRMEAQTESKRADIPENHYRIFVYGGRGILLASTSNTFDLLGYMGVDDAIRDNYYSTLKNNGFTGGIDVYRMLNSHIGYGIKYQYFNTSNRITTNTANSPIYYYNNYTYNGDVKENIYMNYIGVGLYSNIVKAVNTGFGMNYSLSVGPAFYRNERQLFTDYTLITKTTFGADLGVGLDYHFTKQIAIGVRFSGFYASMPNVVINDGIQSVSTYLNKAEFAARLNCIGYLSVDI